MKKTHKKSRKHSKTKRKPMRMKAIGKANYPKKNGRGSIVKTLYKKGNALFVKIGKKFIRVRKT